MLVMRHATSLAQARVRLRVSSLAAAAVFVGILCRATDPCGTTVTGYCKAFSVGYELPGIEAASLRAIADTLLRYPPNGDLTWGEEPLGQVIVRLRASLYHDFNRLLSLEASYDLAPRLQDRLLFGDLPVPYDWLADGYRCDDLDDRLYPSPSDTPDNFGVFHNLDRAVLTLRTAPADIYIGRQAIAWGSARGVNPTDIITPFVYQELDTEDRPGVDAARVRIPIGFMGEFDLGYVAGKRFRWEKSAVFGRGRFRLWRSDVSLLMVGFREHLMLGLDVARSIGRAGFWLEAAHVFVDALSPEHEGEDDDYFRSSVGFDHGLTDRLYGSLEYHFNSAGEREAGVYEGNTDHPAYAEGATYLMGKHYIIPSAVYQFTPLIVVSGGVLVNLADPSVYVAPRVEYNISENVYLAGGGYVGVGERPLITVDEDAGGRLTLRSEFGSYPDMLYTSLRIYF